MNISSGVNFSLKLIFELYILSKVNWDILIKALMNLKKMKYFPKIFLLECS